MKKLFLSISAPILALSPIVAVVACGKTTDVNTRVINKMLGMVPTTLTSEQDLSSVTDATTFTDEIKRLVLAEILEEMTEATPPNLTDDEKKIVAEVDDTDDLYSIEFVSKDATDTQKLVVKVVMTLNKKVGSKNVTVTGKETTTAPTDQEIVNQVKIAIDNVLGTAAVASSKDENAIDFLTLSAITKANFHTQFGINKDISAIELNGATLTFARNKTAGSVGASYVINIDAAKGSNSTRSTITVTSNGYVAAANPDQTDVNAVRTQFLSSTPYTSTKDAADLPATSATDATWADVAAFTATTGVTIAGLDFNGATVTYIVTKTPSTTPSEPKATLSFTITIKKGDPAKSAIATIEVKSRDTNAVAQEETDAQKVQSIKNTFGTPTGLNNKEINALDGLVTSSENYSPFNNDAITALGITATIPGELKGVILTYKVTELTSPFGAPSTYNLEIKFALNSENQKIDVTLTSSNSNPTAQEALDDVYAAFLLQVIEGKQFMSSKNGADLPADGADLSSTTSFSALSSLLGITIAGDDLAVAPIAVSFTVANATGSTAGEPVNKLTVTISWTITDQTVTTKISTIVVSSDDLV